MIQRSLTISSKVNMALGLIVCTLAAIVYISLARVDRDDDSSAPALLAPFADMKAEEMKVIRLELKDRDAVQLKYLDNRWLMTEPLEISADTIHMEAFLDQLRTLRMQWLTAAGDEEGRYLQKQPAGWLTVAGRKLWFGKNNPLDYRRYMKYDGGIYLASDEILALVNRELFFADQNLWREPRPPKAIKKDGQIRQWPDPETRQQTLLAWQTARAIELKRHDDTDGIEGKEPTSVLSAMTEDGTWVDYRIMEEAPDLVLVRVDLSIRYHLPATLLAALTPAKNDD